MLRRRRTPRRGLPTASLTVKIAKPGAPPPPQRDETLDIELVSIGQLAEDGAWLEARHSLDALGARIDARRPPVIRSTPIAPRLTPEISSAVPPLAYQVRRADSG